MYRYTYDNVGNITRVNNAGLHYGSYNYYSYQYDALNQLTHAVSPINGYEGLDETFSYVSENSNVGNIQQRVATRLESGYPNETNTYNYTYDSVWSDKLLSVTKNGTAVRNYSYLSNGGTPSTDGNFNFNWSGRRLTSVYDISEQRYYSYTYDYSGRRISKQYIDDNGNNIIIKYYYTGDRLSSMAVYNSDWYETYLKEELRFEYDATGVSFINHTVYGDSVNEVWQSRYWVVRNIQGDVTALVYVDRYGNAETAVEYYYSAFGEVYVDVFSGSIDFSAIAQLNPIRYRGYFYDTETGFYYLDSRYYDPEIGRFINGDTQINNDILGSNIFTYCSNNPINYVDPTGKAGLWLLDYLQNFCSEFLNALNALSPAYATSSGLALADGPFPFGEILAGLVITGLTVGAIGYSAFQATQVKPNTKTETETKVEVDTKDNKNSVIFPINPNDFNPVGLIKKDRAGSINGSLISWMDPKTNTEVFRWDENINFSNGPHYHIYSSGHYKPGIDIVPEPYASIYFPIK